MSIASAKFVACGFLVVGALTLGNRGAAVPVAAEGNSGAVHPTGDTNPELTLVAFLDDERKDGEERERQQPRRESEQRREREPRKEAERQRREGERPRDGEARRDGDRPRETDQRRDGEPRRETFRPQTENEEALYRMIVQLQRQVAELRSALRARDGGARGEASDRGRDQPRRDGDRPRGESDRPGEREGERPAAPREGGRRDADKG